MFYIQKDCLLRNGHEVSYKIKCITARKNQPLSCWPWDWHQCK